MSSLGAVLIEKGNYTDAEEVLIRVLKGREHALGTDHTDTRTYYAFNLSLSNDAINV
jgi:hypothetical protein